MTLDTSAFMPTPRQLVLIMTDTQRRDMLGCYGNPAMQTPHLDRLAREGVRFDRAYCCQPVCAPARAALFTGIWPHGNGVWTNCLPLGANVKTVGQRLQAEGLHCAYIGKWHLDGSDYFGLGRAPHGWDPACWYDMRNYLEELSPAERQRSRRFETCLEPGFTADMTYAHRCSDRAIRFLEQHAQEDFLLVVSYDEPHGPSLCPAPYNRMFANYDFPKSRNVCDDLRDKPEPQRLWAGTRLGTDREGLRIRAADFLGCNAFVDSEVGRVLDAVDRRAPGALVIYTADHGSALASHGLQDKGPAMYDEITRVPLLARWPGVTPAGSVCTQPVSHIALTATLLDACGLPIPPSLDGRASLLPALAHPESRTDLAPVFMEFGRYEVDHDGFGGFQPIRAICDGRHKLVINLLATDEFYDLTADPDELHNRIEATELTTVRDRLHDRLLGWMNETRDPFRGYHWERRTWRRDARAASWDYTGMTRQREGDADEPRQLDYLTGMEMTQAHRPK